MGKQAFDAYIQFKGRGRYKLPKYVGQDCYMVLVFLIPHSRSKSSTTNTKFETNPYVNDGLK